ncbi:hypothetical protein LCM20_15775 [Halobacillus litoralis]|uniref:hypothetical protein n=1 Tax=Halobacillus litoralis TaxID=45668 RepID=UPI001CD506C0|nr:hypothetical protein [Halobacillus litoralis]MCA0972066.1 hypothetical protein [Halobacillus litoralis]
MARRKRNWVALGTAGALGAAAMYGVTRMNQNGGFGQLAENTREAMGQDPMERVGEQIQSAHQASMNQLQNTFNQEEL